MIKLYGTVRSRAARSKLKYREHHQGIRSLRGLDRCCRSRSCCTDRESLCAEGHPRSRLPPVGFFAQSRICFAEFSVAAGSVRVFFRTIEHSILLAAGLLAPVLWSTGDLIVSPDLTRLRHCLMDIDLKGRNAIVTGSSIGSRLSIFLSPASGEEFPV